MITNNQNEYIPYKSELKKVLSVPKKKPKLANMQHLSIDFSAKRESLENFSSLIYY